VDKAIAWYLVELERELHGRLGSPELESVLQEIEAHLLELKEELMQPPAYVTPEELVRRFGSPKQIAQGFSDAVAPSLEPHRKVLPILMIGSLCLIGLVPFVGMVWDSIWGGPVPFPTLITVGFLPFVVTSLMARRLMVKPILVGCAMAAFLVTVLLAGSTYDVGKLDGMTIVMKRDAAKSLARISRNEVILERQIRDIDQGIAAFVKGDPGAVQMMSTEGGFRYPTNSVRHPKWYITVVQYGVTPDAKTARNAWRAANIFIRPQLRSELEEGRAWIASITESPYSFVQQVGSFGGTVVGPAFALLGAALALNLMVQAIRGLISAIWRGGQKRRVVSG
jgi:hypothetical protein